VDVVRDQITGLLYEPGDGLALAACVERLHGDPCERRRMGRAARMSVADKSWDEVNEALVEHYREVIDERRLRLSA
jgi:phosphatidylinositol alpha 1,6-mannosyltransferase